MPSTPKPSRVLHLALERISSIFRAQMRDTANEYGLKLVQLEVLVYLSVANRYSDTSAALVEYLGVTKGTVSQTIRALERRGLLEKQVDSDDGRVLHCHLTAEGLEIAEAAHPASFLDGLAARQQKEAQVAGSTLLRALQASRGFRTFGRCRTCRHFTRERAGNKCGLTGEPLSDDDSSKICREHEDAAAS